MATTLPPAPSDPGNPELALAVIAACDQFAEAASRFWDRWVRALRLRETLLEAQRAGTRGLEQQAREAGEAHPTTIDLEAIRETAATCYVRGRATLPSVDVEPVFAVEREAGAALHSWGWDGTLHCLVPAWHCVRRLRLDAAAALVAARGEVPEGPPLGWEHPPSKYPLAPQEPLPQLSAKARKAFHMATESDSLRRTMRRWVELFREGEALDRRMEDQHDHARDACRAPIVDVDALYQARDEINEAQTALRERGKPVALSMAEQIEALHVRSLAAGVSVDVEPLWRLRDEVRAWLDDDVQAEVRHPGYVPQDFPHLGLAWRVADRLRAEAKAIALSEGEDIHAAPADLAAPATMPDAPWRWDQRVCGASQLGRALAGDPTAYSWVRVPVQPDADTHPAASAPTTREPSILPGGRLARAGDLITDITVFSEALVALSGYARRRESAEEDFDLDERTRMCAVAKTIADFADAICRSALALGYSFDVVALRSLATEAREAVFRPNEPPRLPSMPAAFETIAMLRLNAEAEHLKAERLPSSPPDDSSTEDPAYLQACAAALARPVAPRTTSEASMGPGSAEQVGAEIPNLLEDYIQAGLGRLETRLMTHDELRQAKARLRLEAYRHLGVPNPAPVVGYTDAHAALDGGGTVPGARADSDHNPPDELLRILDGLKHSAKQTLQTLVAECKTPTDRIGPSNLAQAVKISERTVSRALNALKGAGLAEKVPGQARDAWRPTPLGRSAATILPARAA